MRSPLPHVRSLLVLAVVAVLTTLLAVPAVAHEPHRVQRGDTLASIARQHDAAGWQAVYEANAGRIADPDVIYAGQTLTIPGGSSSQDTAAAGQQTRQASGGVADVWVRLAECESDRRWHLDSRYDGGLQFHPATWRAFGGERYAPYAHQASRAEQVAIARRVQDAQGWGAWPACARELGLR